MCQVGDKTRHNPDMPNDLEKAPVSRRGQRRSLHRHIPDARKAQQEHNRSISDSAFSPDLAIVVNAWGHLPKPIKHGILAMVKSACGDNGDT